MGAMLSSPLDLWDFLEENYNKHVNPKQQQENTQRKWQDVIESIKHQTPFRKELEGNIAFSWADTQRFFSFSNTTLNTYETVLFEKLLEAIKSDKHVFSYQKRYIEDEIVLAFPTVLGFPFIYTQSTPVLMSVSGRVELETVARNPREQRHTLPLPKKIVVKPEIDVTYSQQSQSRFQVSTPFNQYMVGYDKNIQVHVPISFKAEVSIDQREVKLQLLNTNLVNKPLVHYSTVPFTTIRNAKQIVPVSLEKNTKTIHVRKPVEIDETFIADFAGIKIRGSTEKKEVSFKTINDFIFRHNAISAIVYATAEQTIEATDVTIESYVPQGAIGDIVLTLNYDSDEKSQENSRESESLEVSEEFHHQMQPTEFLKKVSVSQATSHSLRLSLKVNGRQPWSFESILAVSGKASNGQVGKLAVYAKRDAHQQPKWEATLLASAKMPKVDQYNFKRAIQQQENGQVVVSLKYGENQLSTIRAEATFERTQERLRHVQKQPQAIQCENEMIERNQYHYGCRNATFHAGLFDKYLIKMNYEQISARRYHGPDL